MSIDDQQLPPLTVAQRLTPQAMLDRAGELTAASPELQATWWILGSSEQQLQWLHSIGVTTDAALASMVPPVPPLELRQLTAAPEEEIFLWTGFVDVCTVLTHCEAHARLDASGPRTVLDFGCGCGRLTRFFPADSPDWSAYGSDINGDHVAWCQQNLSAVTSLNNGGEPPLDIDDASIDFVYCLSVFSHLPDAQARAWIAELARVVRPGGTLLMTTHGSSALRIIEASPLHQSMFEMTAERAIEINRNLDRLGYTSQEYAPELVESSKTASGYGNCFTSEHFIRNEWTPPHFELAAHLPGGLRGWQDISVLRRL